MPAVDRNGVKIHYEGTGRVDRDLFVGAGDHGFIGTDVDEALGGGGTKDSRWPSRQLVLILLSCERSLASSYRCRQGCKIVLHASQMQNKVNCRCNAISA
jgi:hypothetical protein